MNNIESAVSCYDKGFTCSQAVLSTYAGHFGLDTELALKVSCAFGGGMARMANICGAVTGAFMVIGLKHGKVKVEDKQAKIKTYGLAKDFVKRFRSRNGSIACKELLGLDISTLDGMKIARDKMIFKTLCPNFIKDATEIIDEILLLSAENRSHH